MKMSYNVDSTCNDMRLDRWMRNLFGKIPQSLIEKNLRAVNIKLNKKKIKSSHKVKENDRVDIFNIDFKKIVVQKKINGMGTAIQLALRKTKTKNFFSLWGDQLGLSSKTIRATINFFEKKKFPIVFPAVYKKKPYTIINFKNANYLKNIKQSRERKIVIKKGYSDCGFFCCKTTIVKKNLSQLIRTRSIITKKTKEYDFLLFLNIFAKKNKIKVLKSSNTKDCIGINFKRDLNLL